MLKSGLIRLSGMKNKFLRNGRIRGVCHIPRVRLYTYMMRVNTVG